MYLNYVNTAKGNSWDRGRGVVGKGVLNLRGNKKPKRKCRTQKPISICRSGVFRLALDAKKNFCLVGGEDNHICISPYLSKILYPELSLQHSQLSRQYIILGKDRSLPNKVGRKSFTKVCWLTPFVEQFLLRTKIVQKIVIGILRLHRKCWTWSLSSNSILCPSEKKHQQSHQC